MSKMTLKSQFFIVLILLIPFFLYGCGEMNGGREEVTQIFEIENTEEIYNYPDSEVITIMKHYMIINPPENLHELKTLVEKFYKANPIDQQIMVGVNKERYFEMYFYRESKRLPRDWQPNEAYLNTDRLEHHKDDLISRIYFSDSPPNNLYYSILSRSSDKKNYGAVIERIKYIDDKIVE